MAELYIHIPGGEQLSIVPEASSSQDWALMGDNKLSLSFQRYECLILPAGAWCEFDGVIFYLLQEYKPTMIHSHLWQYNVAFVDGASWLGVTTALKTIDGEDAPLFTLTAPAAEHAAIIVSNLNRRLGTTMWKVGSVIDTPNITIEYTGKYCGAVLQEIVDDQNTEWWGDGPTLNIRRAEFGSLIELGYRDGLLGDINVTQADNMSSYRTLYPVGSTRNILPTEYGHDRLQLPNGQRSVMMNPAGVAELVEEAAFAGIYPRYKGKVTGVSTSIGQSNDGSQYLIYIVADTAIPFNPNEYEMPGLVKHITFQSGELMGAEFEVNYHPASNEFELITQFQENGSQLPGGMLIPQVGDEYVVWNISMPAEYYPLAEQELLEAAESFAAASTRESNVYKVKLDYIDVQERGLSLRPGQKVRLHSVDYFPEQGYYDSRITRVTRPVNYPGEYTIDVSAVRVVGSLTRLQTSLAAATTKVNSLSNTVQTVVQTVSNAVTLTGNQRVKGVKDFVDGVRVNGSPVIEYDPVINTWLFRGNILAEGGMAAFSNIKGFTPSTITDAVLIDNRTIKQGADGLLYVDLNEVGGGGSGGGSVDPSQLEAYLKPYAKTADVASTYATIASLSAVTSRLNDFLSGSDTDAIINKWSELEKFLAGLAETDDLATILSGKANKATTLAGYGITDAYTKSHIDSNFVTIGTKQEITGEKDFVGGFKVNGGLVEYNATLKTWVFNGDLLVTGGMAAFSNISGFKPSAITDAVLIDDRTIKRNADGLLYAVDQGAGGINEDQLANYLTTNGYLTGITGKMVTDALGYTPLSTTGTAASAYLLKAIIGSSLVANTWNSSDGLSVSGWNTDGGWNTKYGTSLNISGFNTWRHRLGFNTNGVIEHWAAINTTTMSKVGDIAYVADIPTKLSQLTDDVFSGKVLALEIAKIGYGKANSWPLELFSTNSYTGIAFTCSDGTAHLRFMGGSKWGVTSAGWTAAYDLLHSGNYSEYALPKDGTAVAATTLKTSTGYMYARAFNVDKIVDIGADATFQGYSTYIDGMYIRFRYGSANATAMQIGTDGNVAIGGTTADELLHVYGVAKATLLKSAQGYTLTSSAATYCGLIPNNIITGSGNATDFWLYNTTDIKYQAANHYFVGGNVAIGGTTASEKLHVYGNLLATGSLKLGTYNRTRIIENPFAAHGMTLADGNNNPLITVSYYQDHAYVFNYKNSNENSGIVFYDDGRVAVEVAENFRIKSKNANLSGIDIGASDTDIWQISHRGSFSNNELHFYHNANGTWSKSVLSLSVNGDVATGGNLLINGALTMNYSSDERLKQNIRKVNASKILMSLGGVWQYEYIDSEVQKNSVYDGTHFGLIYQNVKGKSLDKMCHKREDGFGTLNYLDTNFISLVAGATMENISEVEKLKKENKTLRKRVEQLEKRIA